MDIKDLQDEVNGRWDAQDNPCSKSAPDHALLHLTKALGKIASAYNDAQHERRDLRPGEVDKYLADLVICAARFGVGITPLDAACKARLEEKFPLEKLSFRAKMGRATQGDSLGIGRDPELMITSVAAAYEMYLQSSRDRRGRFRDLEVRAAHADWQKVLESFATWENFSPFVRYYHLTEWLLKTRFHCGGNLDQDDIARVSEKQKVLFDQLYVPERTAILTAVETLKKKYALPSERQDASASASNP